MHYLFGVQQEDAAGAICVNTVCRRWWMRQAATRVSCLDWRGIRDRTMAATHGSAYCGQTPAACGSMPQPHERCMRYIRSTGRG